MEAKRKTAADFCNEIFNQAATTDYNPIKSMLDNGMMAPSLNIVNHPPRKTNSGVTPPEKWMAYEGTVMQLMMQQENLNVNPEHTVAKSVETWVIGDNNFVLFNEYGPTDSDVVLRRDLVVFHVSDEGQLVGYDSWADPLPVDENTALFNIELQARDIVGYPDQTGIVFGELYSELSQDLKDFMQDFAAKLEAAYAANGTAGLLEVLRQNAGDTVNLSHYPSVDLDGARDTEKWINFEAASAALMNGQGTPSSVKFTVIGEIVLMYETYDVDGKPIANLRIFETENKKLINILAYNGGIPGKALGDLTI